MYRLKYIVFTLLTLTGLSVSSQAYSPEYIAALNKTLPHQFKDIRTGSTLEAVRMQQTVQVYILIDDIEQYEQVLIERSDEMGVNFSQCKQIRIQHGKYPKNYIEITDRYPLSSKMTNVYRIKTVTSDGIIRTYAPVAITQHEVAGIVQK